MIRVYSVLLVATACFTFATPKCEVAVINRIKALRQGMDDSSVLNIVGDWSLVYVSGSVPEGFTNSTCQVSTFYVDKDGKHRASHNGVLAGGYILDFKDGAELVIDPDTGKVLRKTYVVYASHKYVVIAFYTCSVSGPDVSVGSVFVVTSQSKYPAPDKLIADAEESLSKVGLKNGTALTACYIPPL